MKDKGKEKEKDKEKNKEGIKIDKSSFVAFKTNNIILFIISKK